MKRILTVLAALVLLTSAAYATIPVVPYPTSVQEQKGAGFNAKGAAVRCEGALDALSRQWIDSFEKDLRLASGTDKKSIFLCQLLCQ